MVSCEDLFVYFVECNIVIIVLVIKIYSCDVNVWYILYEGGEFEDLW